MVDDVENGAFYQPIIFEIVSATRNIMMKWTSCTILLAYISFAETNQYKRASSLSGIISVLTGTERKSLACHECLIRAVGIKQMRLIKSNAEHRLYWVEGHLDILQMFLSHCISPQLCNIFTGLPEKLTPDELELHGRQQVTYEMNRGQPFLFEKGSFQLAEVVSSSKLVTFDAELGIHHQQKHKDSIACIRKQQHDLTVFFTGQFAERAPVITEKKKINLKSSRGLEKEIPENAIHHCIVIFGKRQEAVCRECLALHSKWLSIRTYQVFSNSKKYSADVCLFTSEYDSDVILGSC